jgi:RNA polymerase sigma-70 factor (ECF subfamily)
VAANRRSVRTDEELMAKVAEGDWDAFEFLLARIEMPLFAFLHRLGARPDIVQDLAQEVMLRLYEHRRRYDPERPFRPWLFGIAVNVWQDSRRRGAREDARLERLWLTREDEAPVPDPHQRAEVLEGAEVVRRAVQALPEAERVPLILRHYHGLSYAEIQEVLRIPLGTVKTRIHIAVQKVRAACQAMSTPRGRTV